MVSMTVCSCIPDKVTVLKNIFSHTRAYKIDWSVCLLTDYIAVHVGQALLYSRQPTQTRASFDIDVTNYRMTSVFYVCDVACAMAIQNAKRL